MGTKDDDKPDGTDADLRADIAAEMLRKLAAGESPASAFVEVDGALAAARAFLKEKGVDHVSQLSVEDRRELETIASAGLRHLKKGKEGMLE